MKKRMIAFLTALWAALALAGCSSPSPAPENGAVPVVASFNAMKEFTEAVGQDKVRVITLIPDGTEPHDFQPTTRQLKELSRARLFVYNGLGMEPWAAQTLDAAGNDGIISVEASKGVDVITLSDHDESAEDGAADPHCWLSLQAAQVEVSNIAAALSQVDPDNADFYQKNAAAYNSQLQSLLTDYQEKFKALPRKHFVTGHAAFAYLCRDFGLTQNSVSSVFAGGEPGPQQLAKLASYCRENQMKTIFTESAVSPKVSETLAREVGAAVQPIYTMESADGGLTYLSRMKNNIENIYASLQ